MWRLASFFYIYIYSKTNLSSDLYNSTIQSLYITSLFSLTSSDWLAFWSLCFTSLLFSSSHTIYLSSFFLKYSLSGTSSLLQVQGATYLLFFSFLFFPFNRDSFNLLFRVFLPRFSHYFFLSPSQFSLQFIFFFLLCIFESHVNYSKFIHCSLFWSFCSFFFYKEIGCGNDKWWLWCLLLPRLTRLG